MKRSEFETLVDEGYAAVPERFREKIKNVAVLVEDEPSVELRREEGLAPDETLLGHYHGIPATERGDEYGIGPTLPDTITLFQKPIEEAALRQAQGKPRSEYRKIVARIVGETIWHEFAHYFGMDEGEVQKREGASEQ